MPYVIDHIDKKGEHTYTCCGRGMEAVTVTQSVAAYAPTTLFITVLFLCGSCYKSRTVTNVIQPATATPERNSARPTTRPTLG